MAQQKWTKMMVGRGVKRVEDPLGGRQGPKKSDKLVKLQGREGNSNGGVI